MKIRFKPTYKQHLAFQKLTDKFTEFVLFGGGANGGKSWLGCTWLIVSCLMYPETRWFIGREELKRLRDSTLVTFFKASSFYGLPSGVFKYNAQDHYINFMNGSRIDLLDLRYLPSDPLYERYGSVEYTSGWVEEGGEVHYDAYDTLKSRINRYNNDRHGLTGKILTTCNPKKNWMHRDFYKPWKNGTLEPNKAFIQSLITDNDYREKDSIEKLKQITNKAKRERLLFGNWDYEDEPNQLIMYEWLDKALETEFEKGKRCMGVDVARYGDDSSIIVTMNGNMLENIFPFQHLPINEVADHVYDKHKELRVDADRIGVDVVGLGAGVADILKARGVWVKDIVSGAKQDPIENDEGYLFNNLRSQMWWIAREELRKGEIKMIYDASLFEDLTAPRYEISGDKTIKIESKDDIKKRIGRSPDKGDAFVYCNWMRKKRCNLISFLT